jgi:quercetin dioxygenase-like cupin family protein
MTQDAFVTVHPDAVEPIEVGNGIVVRELFRAGPEATAHRACLVRFPAGSQWPGNDVHEPGPEGVYVLRGTFHGLAGPGSVHEAGTYLHAAAGTRHSPSTETGGELFVYYPNG